MDERKYQVFISSTKEDLIKAREKVLETILGLYHLPIGMEMFSAGDAEQWEIIKETVDKSDYYLLILGHRYGTETDEGISYTEKEYDYAKEQGIPILAFVRKRDVATTPEERDRDPNKIEKLNSFVEKATSSKMCDFWKTPEELSTKVAIALPNIFARTPRVGWVRADQAMTPEVAEEFAILSKENREPREKVEQIETRKPQIKVKINADEKLELFFNNDEEKILKFLKVKSRSL